MAAVVSNFGFLNEHDPQLVRFGMLAERYFPDDPNTCLLKLRQFGEALAQLAASRAGLYTSGQEAQWDLLRRLQDQRVLPREIADLFHSVRDAGNKASHELGGDHRTALASLRFSWQLGVWYHRTFKDSKYKSGPFIPPVAPKDESEALREELKQLHDRLRAHQLTHAGTAKRLEDTEAQLKAAREDQSFWEHMAADAETAKVDLAGKLSALQAAAVSKPDILEAVVPAAAEAASRVELDEADTRELIDEKLREAGWEANTGQLRYALGARPRKGRNVAIAEWPTAEGPADYVLFVGLTPVATVEAKRRNIDVAAALKQAQRYSKGFGKDPALAAFGGPWGEFRIPFAFSANGRGYLEQLKTKSGIWFRDLRRAQNLARPLDGWQSPEGLLELLKKDEGKADAKLAAEPFEYGFPLRPYQKAAIQAVERGVADGKRSMLLAMATGTGKTKTCVALIYRFLKTQRFRRVLFLVDRTALGEQAANAFKETRMESLQTFAEVFGIKEIDEQKPDRETSVHIATVQAMVQRVQYTPEGVTPPAVDTYDCIVVDECHRGYLLDRQLSDAEIVFRDFDDYVSKYRRVIDYFDAVKIGLTATPALHTVDIFGMPVYTYSYREAVIDGFLVDHEPPIQIYTELSKAGIKWEKGADVPVYDPNKGSIELFKAPDEIKIEIEGFNRKVITESFNRVVCEVLTEYIDPSFKAKTLVFCATDAHADLVVDLLKKAFVARYGEIEDDAVAKVTGTADRPLELIRRYKNEGNPKVAVTVDLLTTGIDVPEICNLVFLRRVNSRILFDQMLGRATRLCPEIGKDSFRVFDGVRLYEALEHLTAMQPVVVNPDISFTQLIEEMGRLKGPERQGVFEQLLAKLQRKKRHLSSEAAVQNFESAAGLAPDAFIAQLKSLSFKEVTDWFAQHPGLGELLDRKAPARSTPVFVSSHVDALVATERGYGNVREPGDYLNEFTLFVQRNRNRIAALNAVLTRPRELTRAQLKELQLALDARGFTERNLEVAWREKTNEDIAARIVGFIRQVALGDALVPYEDRVEAALRKILASRRWTEPQRGWLRRIAEQTKVNLLVDRAALDEPDLVFRREGGGFARLNKMFDGKLEQVLSDFNDSIWPGAA